jgi:hypothetical protein
MLGSESGYTEKWWKGYEARKAVMVVAKDWTLRLKVMLRELEEYEPAAAGRDGGRYWKDWWG